jgi:pimeloyl-ACP methyl ester carboxylesterase
LRQHETMGEVESSAGRVRLRATLIVVRLLAFALLLLPANSARTQDYGPSLAGMGVVLMHGTLASPGGGTGKLAGLLRSQGALVYEMRMSWSQSRIYDASWQQQVVEIDEAIAQLRAAGARYIVLAGHSRGGTATLVYAALRQRPDALVVLAPGPAGNKGIPPEIKADLRDIFEEIQRAHQLVQGGYGDVWGSFLESDVSRLRITIRFYVWTTARIYSSYHAGSGFDAQNAAPRLPRIPIFWVNTALDLAINQQRIAASMMRHRHPATRVIELQDTFHEDVPDHSRFYVLQWLQSLKR